MIGNILRTMRKLNGYTQGDISEKTRIPQNTLSQYENSVIQPTFETIHSIAKACGFNTIFEKGDIRLTPENIDRKEI